MRVVSLRPPLLGRLINSGVGLPVWVLALAVVAEETPLPAEAGLALVAGGAWVARRGYRLGVVCAGGVVTVRGFLRDRAIPCTSVTHLDRGAAPTITWLDPDGRARSTTINAFRDNPRWPSLASSHAANLTRLWQYIRPRRGRR